MIDIPQGIPSQTHLDEVYLKIDGSILYLWRSVDAAGKVALNGGITGIPGSTLT